MSDKLLWWLVAVLIIVKTILVGWWPFLVDMQMPPRGAGLFLNQAVYLLDGQWLGPYTDLTLATGPVTSIWIMIMYFIGVPLLLAQHALYVCVSIICMLTCRRLTHSKGFQLFAFTLLLFNPFSYNYEPIASASRESLHQSFVLGLLGVSIILFLDLVKRGSVHVGYSILLGVFLLAFWNNGEHRLWIVPFLCWLTLLVLVHIWKERRHTNDTVAKLVRVLLIPLVVWLTGTMAIAWKNYNEYGVFAVVESHTSQFENAFAGIIGIEPEQWDPIVAAPPDVVAKVLSLTSGRELAPEFGESPPRAPIPSHLLPWRLRKAVFTAGYYEKGGDAVLEFYQSLGKEIETRCADQTFSCRRALLGTFPPWRHEYASTFLPALTDVFHGVMGIASERSIEDYFSAGTALRILTISKLVNTPIRGEREQEHFLPDFYKQAKKSKTQYLNNLTETYRTIVPILFWIAILGFASRFYFFVRNKQLALLDQVYVGLAGTMLAQMVIFTLLRITGYSTSPNLYFMFYPVFYTFILVGLLSVTRDIREAISLPQTT